MLRHRAPARDRGRRRASCPARASAVLEQLVAYTLGRTANDSGENWELVDVSGPRDYYIAKTHYLAARIIFNVTITQ